jgi:Flp pilus assembly protein CpaB
MMLYKADDRTGAGTLSMLYQKVRVLAVGSNATIGPVSQDDPRAAAAGNSGVLTFEVPQEAASLIASAALSGGLYLTLVPDNYVPTEAPDISINDLSIFGNVLPGQNPQAYTPYGPEGFDGKP